MARIDYEARQEARRAAGHAGGGPLGPPQIGKVAMMRGMPRLQTIFQAAAQMSIFETPLDAPPQPPRRVLVLACSATKDSRLQFREIVRDAVHVAQGGIGQQRSQLKRWLQAGRAGLAS